METVTSIPGLDSALAAARQAGLSVGLVPTMGALHEGHLSLVRRAVVENDVVVVSIFVNPTQFNDKADLAAYPRTLEADCRLLEAAGVAVAFAPSVGTMYPEPDTRRFSYPPVDTVMEGIRRPGHFNGVCQIVSKLFALVKPRRAYFGEKDYQQVAVVRRMTADLDFDIDIRTCPIVREASGLALSSRNTLLSGEERAQAARIWQTLDESRRVAGRHGVEETRRFVTETLNAIGVLRVEYFEIVDGATLQAVGSWDAAEHVVGCVAVFCGSRPVRLIDNVKYK